MLLHSRPRIFLRNPHSETAIKPLVLAEVISLTCADYLIVLGDRNLRNGSCHCQMQGRLVEKPVCRGPLIWRLTYVGAGHGTNRTDSSGMGKTR